MTPRRIWDLLSTGVGVDELLQHVPEEFGDWVRQTADDLRRARRSLVNGAYADLVNLRQQHDTDRGAIARAIKDNPLRSLIFLAMDHKDIGQEAWKMIRPDHSAPYAFDPDEKQEVA